MEHLNILNCKSHSNVFIEKSEKKGRGLFASKSFKAGETIFSEKPLAAMQTLSNVHDTMVCRECMQFVGSIEMQIKLLKGKSRLECFENILHTDKSHLKSSEIGWLSDIVPCFQNCGEIYCSTECMKKHWVRSHSKLCVGLIPDKDAEQNSLVCFRSHASGTNEIFLLVAEVIAHQLARLEHNPDGGICNALQPYSEFVQEIWWNVVIDPLENIEDTLQQLCLESLSHLKSALLDKASVNANAEKLFVIEHFSRCVGMFEQNNVGIRRKSPIVSFCQFYIENFETPDLEPEIKTVLPLLKSFIEDTDMCDDSSNEEIREMLLADIFENYDMEELFPPLDGTALYSLVCCINHSCSPNCGVVYDKESIINEPLNAQVIALRDIEEGEELYHSYIDCTLPLQDRIASLQDYGFVCDCMKCITESKMDISAD